MIKLENRLSGLITFKSCGICGKSTEKFVKGTCNTVYVRLETQGENLNNIISQAYHYECWRKNVI